MIVDAGVPIDAETEYLTGVSQARLDAEGTSLEVAIHKVSHPLNSLNALC